MSDVLLQATKALRRTQAIREERDNPRYAECGHKLASDNYDTLCGPCLRVKVKEEPSFTISEAKKDRQTIRGSFYLHGLSQAKEDKGLSYREMERATGIRWDVIRDHAVLKIRCNPERAEVLAGALGVSVEELKGEQS